MDYYKVTQTTIVLVQADDPEDALTTAMRGEFHLVSSGATAEPLEDVEFSDLAKPPAGGSVITSGKAVANVE